MHSNQGPNQGTRQENLTGDRPLTPERISQTLAAIAPGVQPISAEGLDPQIWQDYQRLIEVYGVVQSGGVQTQIEATRLNLAQQQQEVKAELDENQTALLQQELSDLDRAATWRIQQLQHITAAEEAAVRQCLPEIEAHLQSWSAPS